MMTKKMSMAVVGVVSVLALTGCSAKSQEQFRDAPRDGNDNEAPARVITMPDGFSNVAGKCDGPHYVYVIFKSDSAYGSVAVVPNDSRCSGNR